MERDALVADRHIWGVSEKEETGRSDSVVCVCGCFMGMGTSRRPGTGSNDSVFTIVVF